MFVLSFFFTCKAKKKESTKEKRKHAVNLRLRYAQPFNFVRLCRISYTRYCAMHTLVALAAEYCLKHEVQVCETKEILQLQ